MNKIMSGIHQSIINMENPVALMAIMSVPVVGSIVKVMRDFELVDQWNIEEMKWAPNKNRKIELINKMNDNNAYAMIGFSVQAIAFFSLSAINPLFALAGGLSLIIVAMLAWNISKNNEVKQRLSDDQRSDLSDQLRRIVNQLIHSNAI